MSSMIALALFAASALSEAIADAVVFDVDLDAGFVDDLVDHLSARSDNVSDLIRIDLGS